MFQEPIFTSEIEGDINFFGDINQEYDNYNFDNNNSNYYDNYLDVQHLTSNNNASDEVNQQNSSLLPQEQPQSYEYQQQLGQQNTNNQLSSTNLPKQKTFNENTKNCPRDYLRQFILRKNTHKLTKYFNNNRITQQQYLSFCNKFFKSNNVTMKAIKQALQKDDNGNYSQEQYCFQQIIVHELPIIILKNNLNRNEEQVALDQWTWVTHFLINYIYQ
ncbi:hypothetical protein TTHERM_00129930 (macronuclear) [Tetrahymena thermophila SB210]|uniref:Uncharacterized protein n=1 Tax=Tetrahymena thermophila (strain SB210) TaxID=312017 RepID=I7M1F3_TETTS|nr:hypothetical protein TTHERM_00129930 [Tetrahymena thermophila SB210]EAR96216.1 hypothetical protein TTHERM_00129930 [Tetrahymena thermophila SB210]|eukprot:XP_001016461.1 hypothetical protein TTHERM_00129930 [Tetrahymena thermophila SB210]